MLPPGNNFRGYQPEIASAGAPDANPVRHFRSVFGCEYPALGSAGRPAIRTGTGARVGHRHEHGLTGRAAHDATAPPGPGFMDGARRAGPEGGQDVLRRRPYRPGHRSLPRIVVPTCGCGSTGSAAGCRDLGDVSRLGAVVLQGVDDGRLPRQGAAAPRTDPGCAMSTYGRARAANTDRLDRDQDVLAGRRADRRRQKCSGTNAAGGIRARPEPRRGPEADTVRRDVRGDGLEIRIQLPEHSRTR